MIWSLHTEGSCHITLVHPLLTLTLTRSIKELGNESEYGKVGPAWTFTVRTTSACNYVKVSWFQIDLNCVDVDKSVFYLVKTRLSQGHSRDKFIAKASILESNLELIGCYSGRTAAWLSQVVLVDLKYNRLIPFHQISGQPCAFTSMFKHICIPVHWFSSQKIWLERFHFPTIFHWFYLCQYSF